MFMMEVGKNLMMQLKNTFCNSLYVNCLFRIMKKWEYGYQNLFFLLTIVKNCTQFFLLLLMTEREYIHNSMFLLSRLSSWNLSGVYYQPQTWLDSPRRDQIVLPSPEKAIDSSESIGATRYSVLFSTCIHPPVISSAWPHSVFAGSDTNSVLVSDTLLLNKILITLFNKCSASWIDIAKSAKNGTSNYHTCLQFISVTHSF